MDGQPATGVEVSASGSNRWVLGNLGAMPTTTIDYATYEAVGWTIVADSTGTTFTNGNHGSRYVHQHRPGRFLLEPNTRRSRNY